MVVDRLAVPVEEVAQQTRTVAEVVLQRVRVPLIGGAGDLAHRRQLDPLLGEQSQRRVEQRGAGVAVARSMLVMPSDPTGGPLEQRDRRRVQAVADLTRGEPGAGPSVRALEDDPELVAGEHLVPVDGRQVAVAAFAVAVDQLGTIRESRPTAEPA